MDTKTFSSILSEHYDIGFGLNEKDQIKYWLIDRYLDRVSQRLKNEHLYLRKKAKKQAEKVYKEMLYKDNPFLKMIPKGSTWSGVRNSPLETKE